MSKTYLVGRLVLCVLVFTGSVCAAAPTVPEPIKGFRELKFGMTPQEVEAVEACSSSWECLYPLEGKNRYVYPGFGENGDISGEEILSRGGGAGTTLSKITVDMGRFDEDLFAHLQHVLTQHYALTYDTTDENLEAFHAGRRSEIIQAFGNGQILLKVVRRKFGNLITQMVYLTPELANAARQAAASSASRTE